MKRRCPPLYWAVLQLLARLGVLKHLNLRVPAVFGATRIRVPVNGGIGLNLLVATDPWMEALLRDLLPRFPGTFVDVGVNVGQTLCQLKAVEPGRAYLGAEPDPACAHYTQELIHQLGLTAAHVVPTALGDRDTVLLLESHAAPDADPTASVVPGYRPGFTVLRRRHVAALRFDSFAAALPPGPIGVVKIDVEGAELEVLAGMEQRLRTDRPAVVVEILPPGGQPERLRRQKEVEALLERVGLRLHRIEATGPTPRIVPLAGPIGEHADHDHANYLALPVERCQGPEVRPDTSAQNPTPRIR
ncbi:MAG: FkbM family methyltransferase [Flavobacteriales bacterium]|nr:hypothetical protein [Flavobacteriales bacterium]MCC6577994.1 FkbM family methyltransferase [Flavobacteriales bacterium]NUQ15606.1 FkbM family methyltransferase [Flavobacteriales bacterium]